LALPFRPFKCIDAMEHFYDQIPGWFDFSDLYADAVRAAHDGAQFVEIGCWYGRSTAFLAVEVINSGKVIFLDVVDTFQGTTEAFDDEENIPYGAIRADFDRNLWPAAVVLGRRWRVKQTTSVRAANDYEDASVDFIFIDAAHDLTSVREDLRAWWPKVKRGGQLAGHDIGYGCVRQAVGDFFPSGFAVRNQSWAVTK
jgi:SAM-dependent methyltransferase